MNEYFILTLTALIMGTIARVHMMNVDYRQYPTYPQGYLSHFTLGMIAAGLGAVAVPAIAEKEYAAITFLALAAQQFRDVRNMERQSLDNIEPTELVPRGTAYIEDIAKAFEARNYMAILSALGTGVLVYIGGYLKLHWTLKVGLGVLGGIFIIWYLKKMLHGRVIDDIAEVRPATITFEGSLLTINGVTVMNIGLPEARKTFIEQGVAVEIIPRDENAVAVLSNAGQRQAIQHNAATQLGIRKDVDEPEFTPIARRNPQNGNVVLAIVTRHPSEECLVEVVRRTPVLESSKRKPLDSEVGKKLNR